MLLTRESFHKPTNVLHGIQGLLLLGVWLTAACAAANPVILVSISPPLPDSPQLPTSASWESHWAKAILDKQRSIFVEAEKALRRNKLQTFDNLYQQLNTYPLQPYLDFKHLSRRLYKLPYEEVDNFLDTYNNTYLGQRMLQQWLDVLAKRRHWHEYQSYYQETASNTQLKCLYLRARVNNGETEAFEEVASLWNVGRSQPKQCDPLFKAWKDANHLTPELSWQRFGKAIEARRHSLAKYVSKQFPQDLQAYGKLYLELYRNPDAIQRRSRFREQSPKMQEIILYGIRRFSRRNPTAALYQWQRYDAQHTFETSARAETLRYLATRLYVRGHTEEVSKLVNREQSISNEDIIEKLLRASLKNRDWKEVSHWLDKLPTHTQQDPRWRYWRARAMQELGQQQPDYPTPEQLYTSLALERNYYGFLAADLLGRQYTIGHNPVSPPQELVFTLRNLDGMRRAKELFELGRYNFARKEWFFSTKNMDNQALMAAGKLAEEWGWYRKGIQAMIDIKYWDDIQLRFPLAYEEIVTQAATDTAIEPTLLFAIARQESAFAPDAKSPAGAVGLMQLMPSTARQTARRNGIKFKRYDLLTPDSNITLGSRYLHTLLKQFGGNRILATAAYNAGPHRVNRWLKNSAQQLPHDVWIETIPFEETRHYVQRVLAYSVIYGIRMGENPKLLTNQEAQDQL